MGFQGVTGHLKWVPKFTKKSFTAVFKYVGTRKKFKQTMKFQVLVARCGIALSLSGLSLVPDVIEQASLTLGRRLCTGPGGD